jgi:putative ABC transport system ATP-binding protein
MLVVFQYSDTDCSDGSFGYASVPPPGRVRFPSAPEKFLIGATCSGSAHPATARQARDHFSPAPGMNSYNLHLKPGGAGTPMRPDRRCRHTPAPGARLTMSPPLIQATAVERRYRDGDVVALRGVSFTIERGEFVSVMGPSGSGKSTLLHILGGLESPTAGEVRYLGENLEEMKSLARFRARAVGFVFQSFCLLPTLTALENVQVPMLEMPWPRRERRSRAEALLETVGLGHRLHHLPSKLSGGERQRVAIARSLANGPGVLLADEPTGNLDSASARSILELVQQVHLERQMTVIVVTHDPGVASVANRVLRMMDGRIVEDGSPAWRELGPMAGVARS